ncbi:MAG: replication initiation protein [Fibromonadaceae bacterium]|jgi:hypothetical protein|nr:replication initiation protein [Fibromonadaceae bacterium]
MQTVSQDKKLCNSPLQYFKDTLPERPFCTDELGPLFVRVKEQAIKRRYIQQNTPFDLYWFVYDVDRESAHYDWHELHAPAPNITATNLKNGHAHLFYGLEVPVLKCESNPKVHYKPIRYAASVDVALTKKLNADPGYSGLICKNPLHDSWMVQTWEPYPYELGWIADYLDLEPYEDRRKHLPPIGLGRNCTIFDVTRHWAYRQIRQNNNFLNEDFFIYHVIQYADYRNQEFPVPLPKNEIKHIGKSIGKWTWRNMSPEGFKDWGNRRREKSIIVRQTRKNKRDDEIREYKRLHPKMKAKDIAEVFQVSLTTVKRVKLPIPYTGDYPFIGEEG